MGFKQLVVCNHCSLGCVHCPYACKCGEDFVPSEIEEGLEPGAICVLTGGEPLEAATLNEWIDYLVSRRCYFRIATAGFVPISNWRKRLARTRYFLGFNLGTDVLIGRSKTDEQSISTWESNWHLCQNTGDAWLTITLGDGCGVDEAKSLIRNWHPRTVMINSISALPNAEFLGLGHHFPEVTFIRGFNC